MKENRSLEISLGLQSINSNDILEKLNQFIYIDFSNYLKNTKNRNRIFSLENTYKLMILGAYEKDKSLTNCLNLFKQNFDFNNSLKIEEEKIKLLQEEIEYKKLTKLKRGRPKKFKSKIIKSHKSEISLSTSAFSQAKDRVPLELIVEGFNKTTNFNNNNNKYLFHGMEVFITDGTYLQIQDTEELQKIYGKEGSTEYPKALLQCLIGLGSGIIKDFEMDSHRKSELSLVQKVISRLEENKLILADDLYNCYGIFQLIKNKNCHLIVPGKRVRKYTIVENYGDGDEIVKLYKNDKGKVFTNEEWKSFPEEMKMRRISFKFPGTEKDTILYTTLLDKKITKEEIIIEYKSRWDIEINIREIKTIMGLSVLRSKSKENVKKELLVSLTSYNIARIIIQKSVKKTDFPPQRDIVEEIYTINNPILMDKTGRVYHHWSSGRNRKIISKNIKTKNSAETK